MKKNENYPKYVKAMKLMDEGKSENYVRVQLHMNRDTLKRIRSQYLSGGELALLRPQYCPHLEVADKEIIVLSIIEKGLSLQQAAVAFGVSVEAIRRWKKAYEQFGLSGLDRKRCSNTMNKKRQKTEAELDELEMLRRRNEYLEAENALLKKVRALVEAREARLRAIGQKPSKN